MKLHTLIEQLQALAAKCKDTEVEVTVDTESLSGERYNEFFAPKLKKLYEIDADTGKRSKKKVDIIVLEDSLA